MRVYIPHFMHEEGENTFLGTRSGFLGRVNRRQRKFVVMCVYVDASVFLLLFFFSPFLMAIKLSQGRDSWQLHLRKFLLLIR